VKKCRPENDVASHLSAKVSVTSLRRSRVAMPASQYRGLNVVRLPFQQNAGRKQGKSDPQRSSHDFLPQICHEGAKSEQFPQ
jgi:hypothetical protein